MILGGCQKPRYALKGKTRTKHAPGKEGLTAFHLYRVPEKNIPQVCNAGVSNAQARVAMYHVQWAMCRTKDSNYNPWGLELGSLPTALMNCCFS